MTAKKDKRGEKPPAVLTLIDSRISSDPLTYHPDRLISCREAAYLLGVSARTIYDGVAQRNRGGLRVTNEPLDHERALPSPMKIGQRLFWRLGSVVEFIRQLERDADEIAASEGRRYMAVNVSGKVARRYVSDATLSPKHRAYATRSKK